MVLFVKGNDSKNAIWIYSGSELREHHCTVEFNFQVDPIIEPVSTPERFAGNLSFSHRPPFEHITFFAVDERTLDVYQQLALAVLMGSKNDALILADQIVENLSV